MYTEAASTFLGTGINLSMEGKQFLGGALGSRSFVESYVATKVEGWKNELETLSEIAQTQPHAAYAALTHGLCSKWSFLSRVMEGLDKLLKPLKEVIVHKLIPALTGRSAISQTERELLSLPARLGGIGFPDPSLQAPSQYDASKQITATLSTMIMEQSHSILQNIKEEQKKIKVDSKNKKAKKGKEQSRDLLKRLNLSLQRSATLSMEKGASNWLSALPLREHGFALHQGAFRDALCLRYGWRPPNLPERCVCGTAFSVEHAMSCPHGGFPIMRHNELRDVTTSLLSEVCRGVSIEPTLQPLANENLRYRTANREEGA